MPADAALLDDDGRARVAALDVGQSYIVQAPAGSGKTELLIQRYLRLLATVAEPEEVVAITFTRKAALEMQLRVVDALQRAADGAAGVADHEQRTLQAAAAVLAHDRECGWQLQQSPQRMRIQTLDAFCASVARLLPLSSGLGGLLTTVADAGMTRLYREAAAATLDWLTVDDELSAVIEQVLRHLDNNTADYIAYLAAMLGMRDQWLTLIGAGDPAVDAAVRGQLEAAIGQQIEARLERARDRLASAVDPGVLQLARYAGEQLSAASGEPHALAALTVDDWPASTAAALPEWRALAELLLTQAGTLRKRVNRNDGFPPRDSGEKKAFEATLSALQSSPGLAAEIARVPLLPDATYRDDQWQILVALFRLLPVAVGELKRLFAARGETDHIEVALAAQTALGVVDAPGDAALLLDYRIRHLLVDELQDTSVGQYRLLEMLTGGWEDGDGRTLFAVGDPMQSIYRFRDAAVGRFLAVRERGIGNVAPRSLVLRRNFRSGEYLVEWFNEVFAQVLPAADDIGAGAIRYSSAVPVEAHRGDGEVVLHPLFAKSPLEEALHTAQVIRDCLLQDDTGEVAVLVRSRTQLPALLAELRATSVAYQAVDIDRLTDLPEIIDVLALTRALCHFDDRIAWLALLRAPWVGLRWRDLHALVRNDAASTVLELLADETRRDALSRDGHARLNAFLDVLQPYLQAHGSHGLRTRVEAAWLALGGAAALADSAQLANVYRFFEVLEGLETAGTIADVALLEQYLDEERVSSPATTAARLQIMTMHRAKGLQFEHVILHGLGRVSGRHEQAVLNWMNVTLEDGESRLLISPLGPRADHDKDPLHRFINAAAKEADRLELDRLLYVACTRAKRSLHLVGSVAVSSQEDALREPPAGSLLHRLWPALGDEFAHRFALQGVADREPDGEPAAGLSLPRGRLLISPCTVPSVPEPPLAANAEPLPGAEIAIDYDWVGSVARHAGTIVHRWLQRLSDDGREVSEPPADAKGLSMRWARALGVAEAELDPVWRRVADALRGMLADADGRWLLFGEGYTELRLTGLCDGHPASVVIDRVRISDDRHWIVDYKTSSHEGGDLPGFLRQEAERYRPQLRRYATIYRGISDAPLELALYFPLLQRFVTLAGE